MKDLHEKQVEVRDSKYGKGTMSANTETGVLSIDGKKKDDTTKQGSGVPASDTQTSVAQAQPEKKGMNFSLGGVDPTTRKPFLGVQAGRDPVTSSSGKLSNMFLPRLDKETGRLYMGQQVGRDKKVDATPQDDAVKQNDNVKSAVDQISKDSGKQNISFGSAFKAAREARLKGGGPENFTWQGKTYHSYQKGEERPAAKKDSGVPAASTGTAGTPAASASVDSSKKNALDTYDNMIANTVSKFLPSSAGKAGGTPAVSGATASLAASTERLADTLVTVDTKKTPGENSSTNTKNGGNTSTVNVSGGGSTELKVNDKRTPEQKKSDEAKDNAEWAARVAAAERAKQKKLQMFGTQESFALPSSLPSSYKDRFREALIEAAGQKFTDADIEKQAAGGRGQTYDKNNPEHRKWADSLRKNYQSKGRYIPPEQPKVQTTAKQVDDFVRSAAASASQQTRDDVRARTDQAAREQAARNSASARAQARPGSYGSRTSTTGTAGQQAPRQSSASIKDLSIKDNLKNASKFGTKLGFSAIAGNYVGSRVGGWATNKALNMTGITDPNNTQRSPVNQLRDKGQDAAAAVANRVPDALSWTVGGAILDKLSGRKPTGNWARGGAVLAGTSLADYMDAKAEKNPALKPLKYLSNIPRGAGYGYGVMGPKGALLGTAYGVGTSIGNAVSDTKVGKAVNLGILDTAAEITGLAAKEREGTGTSAAAHLDTKKEIEDYRKKKQTQTATPSAVDRVRARQQAPGSGVLKKPTQTP